MVRGFFELCSSSSDRRRRPSICGGEVGAPGTPTASGVAKKGSINYQPLRILLTLLQRYILSYTVAEAIEAIDLYSLKDVD